MATRRKQQEEQKDTVQRVMHEFKHGELESSSGKKVRNRKQAIAIALHEAGASKYESNEANEENLKRTKERERRGETSAGPEGDENAADRTRQDLYAEAKAKDIRGRSKMSRQELAEAVERGRR